MTIIADNLIEGVKRRISMVSSQVLLDNDDILAFSDSVISSVLVPLFESTNQEFFVSTSDVSIVASQSSYTVPYRAIGRALRDLKLKSSDGTNVRNLIKIKIEEIELYQNSALFVAFYFKADSFVLVPSVSATYSAGELLEVWFRMMPNKLVELADVSTVVSVSSGTITVDAVPSTFSALTPLDFIQQKAGSPLLAYDKTPLSVSSTQIVFTASDVPSGLQAGDYISLAGYSPVVTMLSDECYPYLESLTAKRCLNSFGDFEGAKQLDQDIADEKKNLLMLLEPRITGEPTVIINRSGLLRGNRGFNRGWLYSI